MERNFCLLIFFTCSLYTSENFWFSYRVDTQNKIIVYEEINISPLMQIFSDDKYSFLCKIDAKKTKYQSTKSFLNEHLEKLLSCFYPMSTQIFDKTLTTLNGVNESSVITITPTKFKVDFNDEFANIGVLLPTNGN